MAIGSFIDTKTLSLGSTISGSLTHGLSVSPHMVWATPKRVNTALTSNRVGPYFSASMNSASISVFNRSQQPETWTVCAAFFHSQIQ